MEIKGMWVVFEKSRITGPVKKKRDIQLELIGRQTKCLVPHFHILIFILKVLQKFKKKNKECVLGLNIL